MVEPDSAAETVRECVTDSPEGTRELARSLGAACTGGEVLLLHGDLGAGKTCFVQGLAAGLGIPPTLPVTSPTFTLHAEYPGRLILNHLDLYRLDDPVSAERLGVEDMLGDPGAVTAIEWPEMIAGGVGRRCLRVSIEDAGGGIRRFAFAAGDPAHGRLLEHV